MIGSQACGASVRRRRKCPKCGDRWTTIEVRSDGTKGRASFKVLTTNLAKLDHWAAETRRMIDALELAFNAPTSPGMTFEQVGIPLNRALTKLAKGKPLDGKA